MTDFEKFIKKRLIQKITCKFIQMLELIVSKPWLYTCTAAITLVSAFVHYGTGKTTIRLSVAIPDLTRIRRFIAHWFCGTRPGGIETPFLTEHSPSTS